MSLRAASSNGRSQPGEDLVVEEPAHDGAGEDGQDRAEQPGAELTQVLDEGHPTVGGRASARVRRDANGSRRPCQQVSDAGSATGGAVLRLLRDGLGRRRRGLHRGLAARPAAATGWATGTCWGVASTTCWGAATICCGCAGGTDCPSSSVIRPLVSALKMRSERPKPTGCVRQLAGTEEQEDGEDEQQSRRAVEQSTHRVGLSVGRSEHHTRRFVPMGQPNAWRPADRSAAADPVQVGGDRVVARPATARSRAGRRRSAGARRAPRAPRPGCATAGRGRHRTSAGRRPPRRPAS